jgi:hypothetical protein
MLIIFNNYSIINVSIANWLNLGSFLSFLTLHRVGKTAWMGDQPVTRPTTYTQDNRRWIKAQMSRVGFEPTTPMFKRAKTARQATVIYVLRT